MKKRANEILPDIRTNRKATTTEAKEIFERERVRLADSWPFLHRSVTGSVTPTVDEIAPGNVFFYQEDD